MSKRSRRKDMSIFRVYTSAMADSYGVAAGQQAKRPARTPTKRPTIANIPQALLKRLAGSHAARSD